MMIPTVTTPMSLGFKTLRRIIASGVEIAITAIMNVETLSKPPFLKMSALM
jgi:hypothetical protein